MSSKKMIFIHTRGTKLRAKGKALQAFIPKKGPRNIPFAEIEELWIFPGIDVTSDVILRTIEAGGIVIFAKQYGTPAVLFPGRLHPVPETRLHQLQARFDERGYRLARAFAYSSIHSRYLLLRYLARNRRESSPDIANQLDELAERIAEWERRLDEIEPNGPLKRYAEEVRAVEGNAARLYYKGLTLIIPSTIWPTRERKYNPPADPFNALLSFANGVLKGLIMRAVLAAGLDPSIGFLHVTVRSGYRGMVYDLTEQFMVTVSHRTAISLVTSGKVNKDWWVYISAGRVYLTDVGRRNVLQAMKARFLSKVRYRGKNRPLKNAIIGEARKLSAYLRGKVNRYEPYIPKP